MNLEIVHQKLKEISVDMKTIHVMSLEDDVKISKQSQSIDSRNFANTLKAKRYRDLLTKKPNSFDTIYEALAIHSENTYIQHDKFKLVQVFLEDIYARFERVGNAIQGINEVIAAISDQLILEKKK